MEFIDLVLEFGTPVHADDRELAAEGALAGSVFKNECLVDLGDPVLGNFAGLAAVEAEGVAEVANGCLLYTSDAADE